MNRHLMSKTIWGQIGIICTLIFAPLAMAAPLDRGLDYHKPADEAVAKLSWGLQKARQHTAKGIPGLAALQQDVPYAVRDGKIQCIIGAQSISSGLLKAISAQGGEIVSKSDLGDNLHQVVIRVTHPGQLEAIAQQRDVRGITEEPEARTHSVGAADNQADRAMRAALARSTYGLTGAGVRVGVISDSITSRGGTVAGGYLTGSPDQISGDLPASIRVIDAGPGGSDEGNAMAQLVYDIAPGCNIAFASAFTSYAGFANNITALRTDAVAPSQIIVDDVSYFGEPMYQDGPIAIAADNCGLNNVPYFSSAANYGNSAQEAAFNDPKATDDTASPPSGNDLHDFGLASGAASDKFLTLTVSSAGNGSVLAILHWDEPYGGVLGSGPGSKADLDLYLVKSTALPVTNANIVASSVNYQGTTTSPSGDPYEIINVTSGLAAGTYHLIIDHYAGRKPVNLNLIVDPGANTTINDTAYLGARTIYGHNSAANVQAVGAINYFEWEPSARVLGTSGYSPGMYQATSSIIDTEYYSSRGGNLPFWFSSNGLTRYASPQLRFKPEITAPDGCDTTFFGSGDFDSSGRPNFYGTSAAAPNAAAVAALMRQRAVLAGKPVTAASIYSELRSTAAGTKNLLPVVVAGSDSDSGDGVVDASSAATTPVPVALSEFEVE